MAISIVAHITPFETGFVFGLFLAGIAIGYVLGTLRAALRAESRVRKQ